MIKNISNDNKVVVKNMCGAFLVKGLSLSLSLFTMPAYMRFFQNQTVLGVWFTIVSVLNWILVFDLGLGNGLRNKLPSAIEEGNKRKICELISTTYFTMAFIVVILGVLGFVLIPFLNWNSILNIDSVLINNDVLMHCVFIVYYGVLLQFLLKLITSVLYAIQKSAVVNLMSLISSSLIILSLSVLPSSTIERNLYTIATIVVCATCLPYVIVSIWVYGILMKDAFPRFSFFKKKYIKDIVGIGITLCWLQIIFMVVSSTNEFLISKFTSPDYVVEYQAYYKIFKTGAMLFSIALTPIWSAVTKAQVKKDFLWIKKIYKIFLLASLFCFFIELAIIPFLQPVMDIWLGDDVIHVSLFTEVVFAFSGTIFVLHNVNSSIGNGISYFKIQMIWMTFAAVVYIPLSYFMVQLTGNWVGIVVANIFALLPYELLAPIYTMKKLNSAMNM